MSISSFFEPASFDTIQLTNSAAASLFLLAAWIMMVSSANTDMVGFLPSMGGIGKKSVGTPQHCFKSPLKLPRMNEPWYQCSTLPCAHGTCAGAKSIELNEGSNMPSSASFFIMAVTSIARGSVQGILLPIRPS